MTAWPDPLAFRYRRRDWRWLWLRHRTTEWVVPEREAAALKRLAEDLAQSDYRVTMEEAVSRLRGAHNTGSEPSDG